MNEGEGRSRSATEAPSPLTRQRTTISCLPYKQVASRMDILDLRISPMGVVPQRERRPRTIVDYTFSKVNQDTDRQAPREAMHFGRALNRVLHTIHQAEPCHGPVYLGKIDLSDGIYHVRLHARDVPKIAVAFPTLPGEPRLLAFPLVLPMGWAKSPPTSAPSPKRLRTWGTGIPTCPGILRRTHWRTLQLPPLLWSLASDVSTSLRQALDNQPKTSPICLPHPTMDAPTVGGDRAAESDT